MSMDVEIECPSPRCHFSWVVPQAQDGWITWGHRCRHRAAWGSMYGYQTLWSQCYLFVDGHEKFNEGRNVGVVSGPTSIDMMAPHGHMRLIAQPKTAQVP